MKMEKQLAVLGEEYLKIQNVLWYKPEFNEGKYCVRSSNGYYLIFYADGTTTASMYVHLFLNSIVFVFFVCFSFPFFSVE